jgi:hypothetical protein
LVLALTLGCSTSAYNCRGSVFSNTMNNWPSAQLHTQTHPRCNINHSAHISVAFVVSEMEVAIVSHSVLDKQRCNWRSSVIELVVYVMSVGILATTNIWDLNGIQRDNRRILGKQSNAGFFIALW